MIKSINEVANNKSNMSALEKIKQSNLEFYAIGDRFYDSVVTSNGFNGLPFSPLMQVGDYVGAATPPTFTTQQSVPKSASPLLANVFSNHTMSNIIDFYLEDRDQSIDELASMGFKQVESQTWMAENVVVRLVKNAEAVTNAHTRIKQLLMKHMVGSQLNVIDCLHEALTGSKGN